MSVKFSWLLGAQAGRHQRALRRYISAHRGDQKRCRSHKEEKRRNATIKKERKQRIDVRTRDKLITINSNSSSSAE